MTTHHNPNATRSFLLRAAAAVALTLVAAPGCSLQINGGSTTRAPATDTQLPDGEGWQCFDWANTRGSDGSECYRSESECAERSEARAAASSGDVLYTAMPCRPETRAYCSTQYWDVRGADPTKTQCMATAPQCDSEIPTTAVDGLTKQSECLEST